MAFIFSCGALKSMNSIITNMMVKLVQKSVKFSLRPWKSKLSAKDIMAAVMKTFPPQMAKLASSAARKARTTFDIHKLCDAMDRTMKTFPPQMAKLANSAARKAGTTYAINKLCYAMHKTMLI
ncbi:putative transcription factor Hap3/NF-YB family [Medicago truncatula]|nr:putative transcription factor Hap3/NF-YB family [Medicago truncatula]